MKKRLLAFVCSVMLIACMPMTALAVSPSAEELVAPRVDLSISSEDATIAPSSVSSSTVAVANVPSAFKIGVLEALQDYRGTSIRVLNVLDVKNLAVSAQGTPIALTAPTVTAADNVKVLAYNDLLGIWEYLPVATLNGEIYTIIGNHSKLSIFVDGVLPESMRFAAGNTEAAVMEYLSTDADQTALNGGKDNTTAMELTSNSLVAPWTGDFNMTYVVVAAAACAVIFMTSRRRLLALN